MILLRSLPIPFLACTLLVACSPEPREYSTGGGGNGGSGGSSASSGGNGGDGGSGGGGIPCSDDAACAPGYCGAGICVSPELLAGGQDGPTTLAVTTDFVYWTNLSGGQIMRWSKADSGSAPEPFVIAQKNPYHVIEYGGMLYWGNQGEGTIARAKTADPPGGAGEKIVTMNENPARLATNGQDLFIAGINYMWTAPVNGGPPAELVTDPNWYGGNTMTAGVAVRGDTVYWSEYLGGRVAMLKSGVLSVIAPGSGNLGTIAVDDTSVYWMGIDNAGTKLWTVEAGGVTALFQTDKETAFGIPKVVVDAKAAYFSVDPGNGPALIRRRDKSTGSVKVLASGQEVIADIAVDATHLYWIAGSSVFRMALP